MSLKAGTIVSHLVYIGLLIGCFMFVANVIQEYSVGKSSFSNSIKPLTARDIPVVAICHKVHKYNTAEMYKTEFTYRYKNHKKPKSISAYKLT